MYELKKIPEDFYVREITKLDLVKKGKYVVFALKKKRWNTIDVINRMAGTLNVSSKNFGFCGIKDKQAVAEQHISVFGVARERLEKVRIKDVEIKFLGYSDERICLGDHLGNSFKIVVRNLDSSLGKIKCFVNYFGRQRFGGNNANIGKALIKKDFEKACLLLNISVSGNDYANALRKEKFFLKFYVNAYQSYLWNKVVCGYIKNKFRNVKEFECEHGPLYFVDEFKDLKVPIVGFLSETFGDLAREYKSLLLEEGIAKEDFIIRAIPEISSEGMVRDMFVKVKKLKMGKLENDEFNKGKFKQIVEFELPKGSYATVCVMAMNV